MHRACFPENPWNLAAIIEIMRVAGSFGLIAWEDESPVGLALALDLGTECEILTLGVVLERRRAGIGLALLESVCLEAHRRGAESVVLEVAVDNIAALGLYAKRGFKQVGQRTNYYRVAGQPVDALVLRLPLAVAAIDP